MADPTCKHELWRHARPGRHVRWENVLQKAFGDDWKKLAASSTWKTLKVVFRNNAHQEFSVLPLEDRFRRTTPTSLVSDFRPRKKARNVVFQSMQWETAADETVRIEVVGDSALVINWLNGVWRCKFHVYDERMRVLHSLIQNMVSDARASPRTDATDFGRHIFRELNALDSSHTNTYKVSSAAMDYKMYRLYFDGSVSATGAGGVWVLYGARTMQRDTHENWTKLASLSFSLPLESTVTLSELEPCIGGVA